ncbi:unnamed protein product [Urochloa humidicola]
MPKSHQIVTFIPKRSSRPAAGASAVQEICTDAARNSGRFRIHEMNPFCSALRTGLAVVTSLPSGCQLLFLKLICCMC